MTHIQHAFLKAGWLQLGGADIPVYFRYDSKDNETYPFLIIFTGDKHAYYDLYNEWFTKGQINQSYLDEHIPNLVKTWEQLRCTPIMFHEGALAHISDFHHWNHNLLESANYEGIRKELCEKRKQLKDKQNETPKA